MSVLRVGKERDDQICQAFRELIRAVNECKKVPRAYWGLLPTAQIIGFISAALIGTSQYPEISPIKITLSDSGVIVLALTATVCLTVFAIVMRRHNLLAGPIRNAMKATPEISNATTITHEDHAGSKVSVIATKSDKIISSMAFNPADGELVRLAYQIAGKKPPMIFNNLGI